MTVFIAMPLYGIPGEEYAGLDGRTAVSLAIARAALGQGTLFARANDGSIDRARAELVGLFLESAATHLLFWDSDIAIPTLAVKALVAVDRPIVAIPYRRRGAGPDDFAVEGLGTEVHTFAGHRTLVARACGLGACLIRRSVLEAVRARHPELTCKSHVTGRPVCAMFAPVFDGGEMLSEDYSFLSRTGVDVDCLIDHEVEHAGLRGRVVREGEIRT